jgi:non-ribosomal peptide synthetase component F
MTIVSLLAVLKAGGAFVLLDISQPLARLKSLILQTNAKLALSSTQYRDTCKTLIDEVFVVCATGISGLEYPQNCAQSVSPRNAAYIIFTSGELFPLNFLPFRVKFWGPGALLGASIPICLSTSVFWLQSSI